MGRKADPNCTNSACGQVLGRPTASHKTLYPNHLHKASPEPPTLNLYAWKLFFSSSLKVVRNFTDSSTPDMRACPCEFRRLTPGSPKAETEFTSQAPAPECFTAPAQSPEDTAEVLSKSGALATYKRGGFRVSPSGLLRRNKRVWGGTVTMSTVPGSRLIG